MKKLVTFFTLLFCVTAKNAHPMELGQRPEKKTIIAIEESLLSKNAEVGEILLQALKVGPGVLKNHKSWFWPWNFSAIATKGKNIAKNTKGFCNIIAQLAQALEDEKYGVLTADEQKIVLGIAISPEIKKDTYSFILKAKEEQFPLFLLSNLNEDEFLVYCKRVKERNNNIDIKKVFDGFVTRSGKPISDKQKVNTETPPAIEPKKWQKSGSQCPLKNFFTDVRSLADTLYSSEATIFAILKDAKSEQFSNKLKKELNIILIPFKSIEQLEGLFSQGEYKNHLPKIKRNKEKEIFSREQVRKLTFKKPEDGDGSESNYEICSDDERYVDCSSGEEGYGTPEGIIEDKYKYESDTENENLSENFNLHVTNSNADKSIFSSIRSIFSDAFTCKQISQKRRWQARTVLGASALAFVGLSYGIYRLLR